MRCQNSFGAERRLDLVLVWSSKQTALEGSFEPMRLGCDNFGGFDE